MSSSHMGGKGEIQGGIYLPESLLFISFACVNMLTNLHGSSDANK